MKNSKKSAPAKQPRKLFILTSLAAVLVLALTGCALLFGNKAPVAVLQADPTEGEAPLTVTFDLSNSNDPDGQIAAFELSFGDGTGPATGADITQTVSHEYQTQGDYTAQLVVTDNKGKTSDPDSIQITVTGEGPPPPPGIP